MVIVLLLVGAECIICAECCMVEAFCCWEDVLLDFWGRRAICHFSLVISLYNLAFSFVTQSNSSLDRVLTPVLVLASYVHGTIKGADHSWVDSPLFIGTSSIDYSA